MTNKGKGNTKSSKFNKNTIEKIALAAYILILVLTFFKVYNNVFDEKINLGGDNAAYYILGNSLATGQGYTNIENKGKVSHNHFPPGYPAIIAAASELYSNNILFIKKLNGFFLLISVGMLFMVVYKITGNYHIPFLTSLFVLLNFNLLSYSVIMMSEIPFLFFSMLSIWLAMKTDYEKPIFKNWLFLLLIISISFTYYIRSTALALFVAVAMFLILKKNWKYVITLTSGFFLFLFPWYLRNQHLGGNAYISQLFFKNPYRPELGQMHFADWFTRFWTNFERYVTREIPAGTFNFIDTPNYKAPYTTGEWIIGIALLAVILWGLFRLKKYFNLIFFYLFAYFGILLLWPEVWYGVRFFLPLIPLLTFLFIYGIMDLLNLLSEKVFKMNDQTAIQIALVIIGLLTIKSYSSQSITALEKQAKNHYIPKYKNYFELADWVNKNAPDSSVTCCRKGELFFLFSHKYVTNYKYTLNNEDQIEFLKSKGTDYVILDQLGFSSTPRYLLPAIKKYPAKFKVLVHLKKPDTYLLKFQPEIGYWGSWKGGKKEGKGTYVWENKQKFVGEWKNNLRTGKGTLYFPNGQKLEGNWSNDNLNGPATLLSKDGQLIEKRIYKNNQTIKVIK